MSEVAAQTLHLVNEELGKTLSEARIALEVYTDNRGNIESLDACVEHLHIGQGVLRLLEIYGAALLAEEMEHVALYLKSIIGEGKSQADGLDALTRAMVQLPGYLERVMGGGRDIALVLLPMLNDLRAVRGHPLLSEGTLLLLNLTSERNISLPEPDAGAEQGDNISAVARQLRPRFQVSLLGWIRGGKPGQHLKVLAKVADSLEKAATSTPVYQLWWVVGGVIEALREGGLDTSVSLKRLLGQADRQIKRLVDEGEDSFRKDPGVELLNNLLYYVARASSDGKRVAAIRDSFRLAELLPADAQIEQARESLSAPSIKLMRTVAAAIKEDLSKVKDVLDIYVRTGMGQVEELTPQVDMLKKISDTLGVLGLGGLRGNVQNEIAQLQEIVSGEKPGDDTTLIKIAATLLNVEDNLDEQLVRLIVPTSDAVGDGAQAIDADDTGQNEYKQVTEAVLRECIVNMARIKDAITQSLTATDAQAMDGVPQLLRGIIAALLMLGKSRAVEYIERIGKIINQGFVSGDTKRLDRLADAIVSIEYYMETVQSGRSDPWYMLDNVEICLGLLERAPELAVEPEAETDVDEFQMAETVHLNQESAVAVEKTILLDRSTPEPEALVLEEDRPDPEFLELFIEEAKEEVVAIRKNYPVWVEDPANSDALTDMRRSFHTLKGSGRMVGAKLIGEFAWSIENLLNRIIDRTMNRNPELVDFVGQAVRVLPELVEQLEIGAPVSRAIGPMLSQAEELAAGDTTSTRISPQTIIIEKLQARPEAEISDTESTIIPEPIKREEFSDVEAEVTGEERPSADEREDDGYSDDGYAVGADEEAGELQIDPVLKEIFVKEPSGHLSVIQAFLDECAGNEAPYAVTEALHRSCHTLSGSANMAGAKHGVRVAEPLNRYIRKLYDNTVGLDDAGLAVVRDVGEAFSDIIANLDEATGYFRTHLDLVGRIQALEQEIDEIIEASEADDAVAEISDAISIDEHLADAPVDLSFDDDAAVDAAHDQTLIPVVSESPAVAHEADDDAEPFDAEIAEIFSEEASELLETADHALHAWRSDLTERDRLAELKRQLHTLKGGARMAGILPMGDLSHELETLLDRLESRELIAADVVLDLVQGCIDELARMREAVSQGQPAVPASGLIDLLREASSLQADDLSGELADGVARAPAPEPAEPDVETPEIEVELEAELSADQDADLELEVEPIADEEPETEPEEYLPAEAAQEPDVIEQADESAPMTSDTVLTPMLIPSQVADKPPPERQDYARVPANLLEELLNNAGEISIFRSRLEQQTKSIDFNLAELTRTVTRLKDQLRKLDAETEAQILHRHQEEAGDRADFDPLEMDRYSMLQQLSRALAESVNDVGSLRDLLDNLTHDAESILVQQARVTTELQDGLMQTRMVPFQRHSQRLGRIVRQAAAETGKRAELNVEGGGGELDRQILERMLPPFEHILRNAVIHGLEDADGRNGAGKSEVGQINVRLHREGAEMVIDVSDDGAGLDADEIRKKAIARGLMAASREISDEDAMQFIFEPGFSTAGEVTQAAGRGVGLDVVRTEVEKLGGSVGVSSVAGQGCNFTVRLPFTLAISQALVVRVGDEHYALPLTTVEGVARVNRVDLERYLASEMPTFEYGGQTYRFEHLSRFVDGESTGLQEEETSVSVILVKAGDQSTALVTDELLGSREIVVKSLGAQVSAIRGISGATILGDGSVVLILDMGALVREAADLGGPVALPASRDADRRTFALVVDDSITVRRVTQRLLERNGMRVMTAKDGIDAMAILQEHKPDVILLDIEMPRMDGYELATHVRNDERLGDVPILMITSRVGEKHRARAIEIGVNDYLGKPYQETQLLDAIEPLVKGKED